MIHTHIVRTIRRVGEKVDVHVILHTVLIMMGIRVRESGIYLWRGDESIVSRSQEGRIIYYKLNFFRCNFII